MASLLILAPSKCRTTILFQILKESLPDDAVGLFEPSECAPAESVIATGKDVLSKALLDPARGVSHYGPEACRFFDRRIFIRRDPRDLLISLFLYVNIHLPITGRFHGAAVLVVADVEQQRPRVIVDG